MPCSRGVPRNVIIALMTFRNRHVCKSPASVLYSRSCYFPISAAIAEATPDRGTERVNSVFVFAFA
jgi:hypothetical protein